MNCTFVVALVALLGSALNTGWAQSPLVTWDVNGINAASTPVFAGTRAAHIDSANLTLGGGITASSAASTFGGSNFNRASFPTALADNDYLAFTISPTAGYSLSLSSLSYLVGKSAGTETTFSVFLTSSATGHSADAILDTYTFSNASPALRSITLSNISSLQGITTSVEFRLYGTSSNTDTFRVRNLTGNDLTINGTAAAVPEPATTTLIVGVVLAVGVWARRRRAVQSQMPTKKPAVNAGSIG